MEGYSYLRNVQDEMADAQTTLERNVFGNPLTDHLFHLEHRRSYQFGNICSNRYHAAVYYKRERSWSVESEMADCRDLQELDAAEVYVKRFKSQAMSVTMLYGCPCAK